MSKNMEKSAAGSAVRKKDKKKKRKASSGKNKYEKYIAPRLALVTHRKRMGWSDEEIAKSFGIALSTFKVYKAKYEELSAALRVGAEDADACVENAFFQRACGIEKRVMKPIKVKESFYEDGKKVKEEERIEYAEEEIYIPPDVTADMFYLKNRMPKRWAEKRENEDDERKHGIILIPEAK